MKTENQILAHFRPFFGSFLADFHFRAEVKKVTSQAEQSRAENLSARAMARARSASTPHIYFAAHMVLHSAVGLYPF